jgi:alcohol dehydrogenase
MMHAMVYRGPGRIRIEEKDIPTIEHPNDAIVRVTGAAICGSDFTSTTMMPDLRSTTLSIMNSSDGACSRPRLSSS